MAKKNVPAMPCCSMDMKPQPMTQPDRSTYGYLDTRQLERRYKAEDRLYAPPATAPVVSEVPGAKNSWNK